MICRHGHEKPCRTCDAPQRPLDPIVRADLPNRLLDTRKPVRLVPLTQHKTKGRAGLASDWHPFYDR